MTTPNWAVYTGYASKNYGVNALVFTADGRDYYFSYKTLVAFRGRNGLVVRQNEWGPTTGKHLNAIDGGSKETRAARLSGEAFEQAYAEEMAQVGAVCRVCGNPHDASVCDRCA